MNEELFAVLDATVGRYAAPFVAPTIDYALREFRNACKNEDSNLFKHPEDYSLWHVGSFDPDMGVVITITPAKLAMAVAYVASGPEAMNGKMEEIG